MPFRDLFPFIDREPERAYEHEVAPTGDVSGSAPRADPAAFEHEGRRGVYRLVFKAMEIPGFPESIRIGHASISQGAGPIWTQRTHISQTPGWRPVYVKHMERVEVGLDDFLTLCDLDVTIPTDLMYAMNAWGEQGRAAVAILAALLDERVAQEQLAEDLIVLDENGREPVGVADHVTSLRLFQSANRMLAPHVQALDAIADLDLSQESPILAASRWYLRGAQSGPTADAIVYLWIALEALAKPPYGTRLTGEERNRRDVTWIEIAVAGAGVDPSQVEPSIGRLAGLRAEVVHGGIERPELLNDGYYAAEMLVRLLLRYRLGLGQMGWPVWASSSNMRQPFRTMAEALHRSPRTEWR